MPMTSKFDGNKSNETNGSKKARTAQPSKGFPRRCQHCSEPIKCRCAPHESAAMAACTAAAPAALPSAKEHLESELGDVLFTMVNISRFLKINPEEALRKTINRFIDRFQSIETQAAASGRSMSEMTLREMDDLWEEAKRRTFVASQSKKS